MRTDAAMPLQAPPIDERTFEDLLREARLRIPRYCPEWTDFNDSDPGMAIVQLFAWFTETMLFQLNQVPERNYIKFLQLLNLELRPAEPARAAITLTVVEGAGITSVPKRARFEVTGVDGAPLVFETTEALDLNPYPLTQIQVQDGNDFHPVTANNEQGQGSYRPFGWNPQIDNALYLGFRPTLIDNRKAAGFPDRLALRVYLPPPRGNTPVVINRAGEIPTDTVLWEFQSSTDLKPEQDPATLDRWRPLTILRDETQGFTREGMLLLSGPGPDILANRIGKQPSDDDPLFWLRCRLLQVPTVTPEIAFVRSNVVLVENLATYQNELVGQSDGYQRRYTLQNRPVEPASVELEVDEQPWSLQADLLASQPNDLHFTLNATTGTITFGDGRRGMLPPPNSRIVVKQYRAGGGSMGNVGANKITTTPAGVADVDRVTNPRPAQFGRDEETLDSLKERAPAILRGGNRAVTNEDFETLALTVAGVAKAQAIPFAHPSYPGFDIPGAITVVIVPTALSTTNRTTPQPDETLCEEVYRVLNRQRLLTTELFVTGPRYTPLAITVLVQPATGVTESLARQGATQAIEDYLAILHDPSRPVKQPYPKGWPFSTAFYPSKLYEALFNAKANNGRDRLLDGVTEMRINDAPPEGVYLFAPGELPAVSVRVAVVLPRGNP